VRANGCCALHIGALHIGARLLFNLVNAEAALILRGHSGRVPQLLQDIRPPSHAKLRLGQMADSRYWFASLKISRISARADVGGTSSRLPFGSVAKAATARPVSRSLRTGTLVTFR
jgi:hypothetical protein